MKTEIFVLLQNTLIPIFLKLYSILAVGKGGVILFFLRLQASQLKLVGETLKISALIIYKWIRLKKKFRGCYNTSKVLKLQ